MGSKPSCHAVMTGTWQPSAADSAANRQPGFGTTTNIINGGVLKPDVLDMNASGPSGSMHRRLHTQLVPSWNAVLR